MNRNFTIAIILLAIGFMVIDIVLGSMYLEKCKELENIMRRAYFQSYLPESGKELVMNFSDGGCFVYRCYRLNNNSCFSSGPRMP